MHIFAFLYIRSTRTLCAVLSPEKEHSKTKRFETHTSLLAVMP